MEPLLPIGAYSASSALDDRLHRRLDVRRARIAEIRVVQAVLVARALGHHDQQVAAVLGDDAADDPAGQVLALVDEHVLGLRRADAVVVERLPRERRLEHLVLRRLGIARVEEALRVLRPRDVREAHPVHFVRQVPARGDVAHLDRAPVGAALGEAVREQLRVRRGLALRQRDRAVLRDRVRIDHQRRLGGPSRPHEDGCLPLQARVLRVEQLAALEVGQADARVVPERGQPFREVLAERQRRPDRGRSPRSARRPSRPPASSRGPPSSDRGRGPSCRGSPRPRRPWPSRGR